MRIRMNKKTIISLALCVGVLFMAVGYSILMTELKINGTASISSTWDIRITGIEEVSTSGSAYNIEEPSFTVDTAKFNVSLVNPGDAKSFVVTIENKGTITAILNSMNITTSGTDAIIYEVDGLKDGDTIASGETKELNVTVRYNSNVIGDPNDRYKKLKVGLEWIQYTNQTISTKTYTVKYNNNGGTGSMDNTTCTVGQSCTLPKNTFTKDGYVFAGWATKATGALVYTDGQSVKNLTSANKSVTLYAVWDNPCTIASDSTVAEGEVGAKYICKVDPNKDPYTFYLLDNNDDGTSDLIMNANINTSGEAVIPGVTEDTGKVAWLSSGTTIDGPLTALEYLHNATKSWTNIEPLNYSYYDRESQGTTATDKGYISFVSVDGIATMTKGDTDATTVVIGDTTEPLRARMSIYSETPNKTTSNAYLYENISSSRVMGYWLLSSATSASANHAYVATYMGSAMATTITTSTTAGVRPVITVEL